jgi:hypothetical protein
LSAVQGTHDDAVIASNQESDGIAIVWTNDWTNNGTFDGTDDRTKSGSIGSTHDWAYFKSFDDRADKNATFWTIGITILHSHNTSYPRSNQYTEW